MPECDNLIIFKQKSNKHLRRVIGFIDTDPNSKTFGCCDRNYWHYKLNDYANARYQELCLILAFNYLDRESEFYQNEKILDLIRGVINFWFKKTNRNGSVNEIYPYEQSFCATAFGAYMITETLGLLKISIDEELKKKLKKTGGWLSENGNWHISNQIAASAVALFNLADLLKDKSLATEAEKRINFLLQEFNKTGYFPEYGGFDLGYNSLTMSCLSRIYQKNGDRRVLACLNQSGQHLDKSLDKYGNYDSIGMSRNTNFIYPFSFKVVKNNVILDKIILGLEHDLILNPDWLDDRYLIGLTNDYLMTYYF